MSGKAYETTTSARRRKRFRSRQAFERYLGASVRTPTGGFQGEIIRIETSMPPGRRVPAVNFVIDVNVVGGLTYADHRHTVSIPAVVLEPL